MTEILTEKQNPDTVNIDLLEPLQIVELINNEDKKVAKAVQKCLKEIAVAVSFAEESFLQGGRLLYFGAGTSGRLGVLDASECPPTFSVDGDMVQGFIAGGDYALRSAVEGAEDNTEGGRLAASEAQVCQNDTVVVLSASGNPNYIMGVLEKASIVEAKTVAITCNKESKTKDLVDCFICVEVGPEAISGSSRMKAGTAQKMVLNMLSTASMIRIGKTYQNFMIDMRPTNTKLKKRAEGIVSQITGTSKEKAKQLLEENGYKIKPVILMIKYKITFEKAVEALKASNGVLRKAFQQLG